MLPWCKDIIRFLSKIWYYSKRYFWYRNSFWLGTWIIQVCQLCEYGISSVRKNNLSPVWSNRIAIKNIWNLYLQNKCIEHIFSLSYLINVIFDRWTCFWFFKHKLIPESMVCFLYSLFILLSLFLLSTM